MKITLISYLTGKRKIIDTDKIESKKIREYIISISKNGEIISPFSDIEDLIDDCYIYK